MNSLYNYSRRLTRVARVGDIEIGGQNPVRVQSMTNTSTMDTQGCVSQAVRISEAGGELVRLTTQGVREADNMANIKSSLRKSGCHVPLVADVHFNPQAAFKAVETCEKVRINPGNFVDPARTFKKLDFTEKEYEEELNKIRDTFIPFLNKCKEYKTAIRLGVNHGSLSDRIMSRYGDTPEGMVESALEYLRICKEEAFDNVVVSIKSSNVKVMVETVELLAKRMDEENMPYPLHLGVTEAGDGEDGRIKSAAGIGTLLAEGLGDTIRVSLTEDPEFEIPVALKIRDYINERKGHSPIEVPVKTFTGDARDFSTNLKGVFRQHFPIVIGKDIDDVPSDWIFLSADEEIKDIVSTSPVILHTQNKNIPGAIASWIDRFVGKGYKNPVILKVTYPDTNLEDVQIKASTDLGPLLLKGYGSGIWIDAPAIDKEAISSLALGILQATRLRMSKTEYIACPSCGRTLFDLQKTLRDIKGATSGFKGLKIGVMGCIVNGPGEMADADFGYVGAGPGKVSLYKGKQIIKRNIPSENAIDELLNLIKTEGIS